MFVNTVVQTDVQRLPHHRLALLSPMAAQHVELATIADYCKSRKPDHDPGGPLTCAVRPAAMSRRSSLTSSSSPAPAAGRPATTDSSCCCINASPVSCARHHNGWLAADRLADRSSPIW